MELTLLTLSSIDKFSILGNEMSNYHLSEKESLLVFRLKPSLRARLHETQSELKPD